MTWTSDEDLVTVVVALPTLGGHDRLVRAMFGVRLDLLRVDVDTGDHDCCLVFTITSWVLTYVVPLCWENRTSKKQAFSHQNGITTV